MGKIYWDCDGVLRDFEMAVWGRRCGKWMQDVDGVDLYDYVDNNISLLETAPSLPYLDVVKRMHVWFGKSISILTCQPKEWIEPTRRWLHRRLANVPFDMKVVGASEDKVSLLGEGDILVDDHPRLVGCAKVVTVTWGYNKGLGGLRVSSMGDMIDLICAFYHKGAEYGKLGSGANVKG